MTQTLNYQWNESTLSHGHIWDTSVTVCDCYGLVTWGGDMTFARPALFSSWLSFWLWWVCICSIIWFHTRTLSLVNSQSLRCISVLSQQEALDYRLCLIQNKSRSWLCYLHRLHCHCWSTVKPIVHLLKTSLNVAWPKTNQPKQSLN